MPRHHECTEETTKAICDALVMTGSITAACDDAGITTQCYYNWRKRGEEGEDPFVSFLDRTTVARRAGKRALINTVRVAAKKDWRAAAWMLERVDPDGWSKRTELTGRGGGPVQQAVTLEGSALATMQGASDEKLQAMLDKLGSGSADEEG